MSRRWNRKRKRKHTTKEMYRDEYYTLEGDKIFTYSYSLHSKRASIVSPFHPLYISIRYLKSRVKLKG